jgi:predicted glycoside hydrolase/deacetylase ChbG (UPF0249 family)
VQPNLLLKKLGLADDDRAVILHADDVGMCHASLAAYADLVEFGLISSASTMVPCPWFPATAAFCCSQPADRIDMGVHLTLTSEWAGYRWGPISSRDPASGMIDAAGYFHTSEKAVQEDGDPAAVQHEIQAQVERALGAGIDVTHVDTHMGSILHPKFLDAYLQLALEHRIPPLLLRLDETGLREMGIEGEAAALFARLLQVLEAQGLPLLDNFYMMPLDQPEDRVEQVKRVLEGLPAGITYLIVHPAQDTPELRAIAPDWRCRVADYQAFTSEALQAFVQKSGIHVLGWRAVRAIMQGG